MKYIKIFILAYLFLQLPYSCSNSNDTQQIILADSNKIEGTWYIDHDATIHILEFNEDGKLHTTTHLYDGKQWTTTSDIHLYTLNTNLLSIKKINGQIFSGHFAITGQTLSIQTSECTYFFSRFDYNEYKINELKANVEDNYLTITPDDDVVEDNFWTDQTDYELAIGSLYNGMIDFLCQQLNLEHIRQTGKNLRGNARTITPQMNEIANTWQKAYQIINTANIFLTYADEQKYAHLRAEVLTIRTFIYYNLVQLWGTIPYTTVPSNEHIQLVDIQIVSQQELLPILTETLPMENLVSNNNFRWSISSAKFLLAEMYLQQGINEKARALLQHNEGEFHLSLEHSTNSDATQIYGNSISIYNPQKTALLLQESEGYMHNLLSQWQSLPTPCYGYWATIKRIGHAQNIVDCKPHELLMPIPQQELLLIPSLKQNPGYEEQ